MSRDHDYFVYIATNYTNTVLYVGVCNDMRSRLSQHALGEGSKFTRRYNVNRLLFYEHFRDIRDAIACEKRLKGWTRAKKEALIRTMNPTFEDLMWRLDPQNCLRRGDPAVVGDVRPNVRATGSGDVDELDGRIEGIPE